MLAGLASPMQLLAQAPTADLRAQLRELAAAHGFVVKGLERLGDDAATPVSGDLRHRIERLLEKYNFVLLHDADGGIAEVRIEVTENLAGKESNLDQLLLMDAALTQLAEKDPRLEKVVECRFFGGLTIEETAAVLSVGARTVQRDWQKARLLLYRDMRTDI
ncbi:MAG: hypothetical protein IH905_16215 [Proteobacteria bacterium]|nr:hypothetical protein [Pseudomonadota bacterium]